LPDDIRAELSERVASISGLPVSHQETWEIIRYRVGEKFDPHYDSYGRRRRLFSAIVYLRSPSSGGETVFPNAKRSFSPTHGTLVVWQNYKEGRLLQSAFHGSNPVVVGEKWSLVTWVRDVVDLRQP
jgi:prolyl 4-hydroxylase